jgi:putative intracellular protease/amidase
VPDPTSIKASEGEENSVKFLNEKKNESQNTQKISSFLGKTDHFDAVYVVGGHGPMFDLAFDADSQALLAEFWEKGKIVAADCAGVGSLANVKLPLGDHILKGKKVTGFSKAEVYNLGFENVVPFFLEDKLKAESGGYGKAGSVWEPHVVRIREAHYRAKTRLCCWCCQGSHRGAFLEYSDDAISTLHRQT